MRLYSQFSYFKLRSDLGRNCSDIESLAIEIINKKSKMLSLVHSKYNQPVILKNIKCILKISLRK